MKTKRTAFKVPTQAELVQEAKEALNKWLEDWEWLASELPEGEEDELKDVIAAATNIP